MVEQAESGQIRMKTRSTNADTRPGKKAQDALRVRAPPRPREIIDKEKQTKAAAKEAKAAAQALKEAGEEYATQLELEDQRAAIIQEEQIPRRRNQKGSKRTYIPEADVKKHDTEPKEAIRKIKTKRLRTPSVDSSDAEVKDTDVEPDRPVAKHQSKKAKVEQPQALRRHETMLEIETDEEARTSESVNCVMEVPSEQSEVEHVEQATPRPPRRKEDSRAVNDFSDSEVVFRTPRTLKKLCTRKAAVALDDLTDPEYGESNVEVETEKKKGNVRDKEQETTFRSSHLSKVHEEPMARASLSSRQRSASSLFCASGSDPKAARLGGNRAPSSSLSTQTEYRSKSTSRVRNQKAAVSKGCAKNSRHDSQMKGLSLFESQDINPSPPRPFSGKTSKGSGNHTNAPTTRQSEDIGVARSLAPVTPRKTSSSTTVKKAPAIVAAVKTKKVVANKREDSKPENAIGGMADDEDDTLERDGALSSPMKGAQVLGTAKSLIKVNQEKGTKRKVLEDLPKGANDKDAWRITVIPNLIGLFLGGEIPWEITDTMIEDALDLVCKHTYGRRVEINVEKGSPAFERASQALANYRSKFAINAITVTLFHLAKRLGTEDLDLERDGTELAALANDLLIKRRFIFKGYERPNNPKETGRFESAMILETLSAHFSIQIEGRTLAGVNIKRPNCALALATAAVERALYLVLKGLIMQKTNTNGSKRFTVIPTENPVTGKMSTVLTDFSAENWNEQTLVILANIERLDDKRFQHVWDVASAFKPRRRGRAQIVTKGHVKLREEDILESESEGDDDQDGVE